MSSNPMPPAALNAPPRLNRAQRRARRHRRDDAPGDNGEAAAVAGNGSREAAETKPQAEDRLDALVCAIAFATALRNGSGQGPPLLAETEQAEIAALLAQHEPEVARMRQLRLLGELYDRRVLGYLMRARLAEMLAGAQTAAELAALSRAAHSLPAWAFGDAETVPGLGAGKDLRGLLAKLRQHAPRA